MRKRPETQRHDDALKSRFGAIVRAFRRRLGVSQEELAWRADVHRTYLADIERGQRNISLTSIVKIVRALGVSHAEFFGTFEEQLDPAGESAQLGNANSHATPRPRVARKASSSRREGRR